MVKSATTLASEAQLVVSARVTVARYSQSVPEMRQLLSMLGLDQEPEQVWHNRDSVPDLKHWLKDTFSKRDPKPA